MNDAVKTELEQMGSTLAGMPRECPMRCRRDILLLWTNV